ncbi:T9SS type A sorting domain-containing protein [Prolixibacteraceae bacterium Z1-6]|uniref:T9SS type A sorting domain-containing protein n=1 Tax=Draconibacterium aestuarii TaxID=2998507 RepID=A0A9X3F825_9BACT|nr:T9SS type A sorting domain-containing protein [Prolixibacteraceae bacterium Z1-6]
MKFKIVFILFLFSTFIIYGQEIKLNSSVVGSAGHTVDQNNLNIAKWRLGEVHLILLQQNQLDKTNNYNFTIDTYPNPFTESLNLHFQTEKRDIYSITVTDISGRKQWLNKKQEVLPNQVVKLNLSFLSSGFYLLTIIPEDKSVQHVTKIQKQ